MQIEKIRHKIEFEQLIPHEIERKFIPVDPAIIDCYRKQARPVEQLYLSHPSEPFTLRLRSDFDTDNRPRHMVTLKDTGEITEAGLDRIEIEASINESTYASYIAPTVPLLRKLRAEPLEGITIDYYENGAVRIESENELNWRAFVAQHGDMFVEVTGDKQSDNEWIAHLEFRRANNGAETLRPSNDLEPQDITHDILAQRAAGANPVIVHIGGRSGSGKSTIVREVIDELHLLNLDAAVLSTDDYHRGEPWLVEYNNGLPWTKWDDPIVYDTQTMAVDLARLCSGYAIAHRSIDWSTVVPAYMGSIEPADIIIIEGIYARAPEITSPNDLEYEMTTGLATCIGRRLLRDMRERPEFADPVKSLRYMIEEAEPAYRQQERSRGEWV
jgi:uridine kinase